MNYKLVKVKFMAELMYWIVLDCVGVPNKVASKCKVDGKMLISVLLVYYFKFYLLM